MRQLSLSLLALLLSLSMIAPVLAGPADAQLTHYRDIVWASPKGFDLALDIAVPGSVAAKTKAKPKPVLVIFHGGGWLLNNKSIMTDLADAIATRADMITVNVDYRLLSDLDNTTTLDEIVADAMGAVLWVKDHIHQYGGDPRRVAVTGDSAGGHLAAMVVVAGRNLGSHGFAKKPLRFTPTYLPNGYTAEKVAKRDGLKVQAAILSYAAFNFVDVAKGGFESAGNPFWGWAEVTPRGVFGDSINVGDHPEYYLALSPDQYLVNVRRYKLPRQFVHVGALDPVTTPEIAQDYVQRLISLGQPASLKIHPDRAHGFLDSGCNDHNDGCFKELSEPAVSDMVEFLNTVFRR